MKRAYLFIYILFCTAAAPRLSVRMEPDSVGLADTFALVYRVEQDVAQKVFFPEFKSDGDLELRRAFDVDTLQRRGRGLILRRRMTFQAFRAGRIGLGRGQALYMDKNTVDTLRTDSLWVQVGGFEIDTAKQTIFDIKPQRGLPVRFGEFSGYLLWGLLSLAAAFGLFLLLRFFARKYHWRNPFRPAPPLPPYERAVRDLEELARRKEPVKVYWSELTDILRRYVGAVYEFGAMEMTAPQVCRALEQTDAPHGAVLPVQEVLRRGDLVKFAQDSPASATAAEAWAAVRALVEATKPKTEENEDVPD